MNDYIATYYNAEKLEKAWTVIRTQFLQETGVTLYITLVSTLFAILIGLPLGVILVTGDSKGIRPLPKALMAFLNGLINLLRSAPFIILIVVLMPVTRAIVGKAVGNAAVIVPLIIAAFPFVARLVEGSLREVNPNIIEMSMSMGATTWQTVFHVMLPESVPSLITSFTTAITTILGQPGDYPGPAALQPGRAPGCADRTGDPGAAVPDSRYQPGQKSGQTDQTISIKDRQALQGLPVFIFHIFCVHLCFTGKSFCSPLQWQA